MNQPRELKELLQILLAELEAYGVGDFGLCNCLEDLVWREKITNREKEFFEQWIKCFLADTDDVYLFPKGEAQPRIEFLKQEIEKLSKNCEILR